MAVRKITESKHIKEGVQSPEVTVLQDRFTSLIEPALQVQGPGYLNLSGISTGSLLQSLMEFLPNLEDETNDGRQSRMVDYALKQCDAVDEVTDVVLKQLTTLQRGLERAKAHVVDTRKYINNNWGN